MSEHGWPVGRASRQVGEVRVAKPEAMLSGLALIPRADVCRSPFSLGRRRRDLSSLAASKESARDLSQSSASLCDPCDHMFPLVTPGLAVTLNKCVSVSVNYTCMAVLTSRIRYKIHKNQVFTDRTPELSLDTQPRLPGSRVPRRGHRADVMRADVPPATSGSSL